MQGASVGIIGRHRPVTFDKNIVSFHISSFMKIGQKEIYMAYEYRVKSTA